MAPSEPAVDAQDEVELVGVLAEFRTALREELDAARRVAAGAGIQLLNGQLIAHAAESYQYAFTLESVLNLPDDLPGELRIPGRRPVEATIVSLEGVSITISVPEPLGDFIARASLQSDLTMLLRILIERIEALSTQPNPAGDRLLGEVAPSGEPELVEVPGMNQGQADAVASALGRDTTFIWGPPGTGKTRTIGKIGEQLVRRERSVLVVSHTNSAVDQAILEIVRDLGDELVDGSVLRLGTPKDQRLVENERLLAETHIKERSQELLERQAELLAERAEKTSRLTQVRRLLEIAEWRAQADQEIASLRARTNELEAAHQQAAVARKQAGELDAAAERWDEAAERADELADKLEEAEPARAELAQREGLLAPAEQRLHEAERIAREAEELHEQVLATGGIRRRMRGLPRPEEQSAEVGRRRAEETSAREARGAVLARVAAVRDPLYALEQELEAFKQQYGDTPDGVIEKANAADNAYDEANERAEQMERDAYTIAEELHTQTRSRLAKLVRWRLTSVEDRDLAAMIGAPKSRYGRRDVPLAEGMSRRLWELRKASSPADDAPLFVSRSGGLLDSSNVFSRMLKPAAKAAGVPWAGFHTLRHSCASILFRRGLNAKQVQVWLGHHSPAFTLATYVHLLPDDLPDPDFLDELTPAIETEFEGVAAAVAVAADASASAS